MVWRISKESTEEERTDLQKTGLYGLLFIVPLGLLAWGIEHLQYIGQNMAKTFKEFAEACWDSHKQVGTKMKGGKRVPNCVPKNEEEIPVSLYDLSELGPAAMARRKRMRARMGMLQKKYSDARKAGIHPSRVSQRHNKMTVKKRQI